MLRAAGERGKWRFGFTAPARGDSKDGPSAAGEGKGKISSDGAESETRRERGSTSRLVPTTRVQRAVTWASHGTETKRVAPRSEIAEREARVVLGPSPVPPYVHPPEYEVEPAAPENCPFPSFWTVELVAAQ